jgi:hypothetical protein
VSATIASSSPPETTPLDCARRRRRWYRAALVSFMAARAKGNVHPKLFSLSHQFN